MLISRTPYRCSFSGGGSDYPDWYRDNCGAVIGTTINKYCWLMVRELPPFFEHKHRIVWSKIELPNSYSEIEHPSVRACLSEFDLPNGMEIHHAGDLPARSGLGSSSAFTVGLLNALYHMSGVSIAKQQLALKAIDIEQRVIGESVGSQDQVFAAYGGLNYIVFDRNGIEVRSVNITESRLSELQSSLMLFFTGMSRTASEIAAVQINEIPNKTSELKAMCSLAGMVKYTLEHSKPLSDFGSLLDEEWRLKKTLSPLISNSRIDEMYEIATKNGAIGGKITGAGSGGFLLLFVPEKYQNQVREKLKDYLWVPFQFEDKGSVILNG